MLISLLHNMFVILPIKQHEFLLQDENVQIKHLIPSIILRFFKARHQEESRDITIKKYEKYV